MISKWIPVFVLLYAAALGQSGVIGMMGMNHTGMGGGGMMCMNHTGTGGGGMMGMMCMNHTGEMGGSSTASPDVLDGLIKEAVIQIYHEDPLLTDVECMGKCDALFQLEIVPQYETTTDHSCALWCLTYGTHHELLGATETTASPPDNQ